MFDTNKIIPGKNVKDVLVKQLIVFFTGLFVVNLFLVNIIDLEYVVLLDLAVLFVLLTLKYTDLVFYAMIVLYPFINLQFVFKGLNVPFVDLLALAVFVAWVVKRFIHFEQKPLGWKDFPGIGFAVVFFFTGVLSFINADFPIAALKYLARPMVFFYLMFLVVPFHLIDSREKFYKVLRLMFIAGLIVASLGVLAIFLTPGAWYTKRAIPFSFGSFNPLGGNQNSIAEVLVAVLPLALILYIKAKKYQMQAFYAVGMVLMLVVLLLTFSRTGWLALLLQMLIFVLFRYRKKITLKTIMPLIIVFVGLASTIYFTVWQNVSWVQESNQNRILLTEIAVDSFLDHPIVGNGLNSFQDIIGSTFVYTVEFGDPLDSHGFIQKVATEQGILGLMAFLAFLAYVINQYVKAFRNEGNEKERFILLALLMMMAGTVFFQLFSTSYYISRMWLPLGVGLAALKLYEDKKLFKNN